jgi:predicted aspartyl protease
MGGAARYDSRCARAPSTLQQAQADVSCEAKMGEVKVELELENAVDRGRLLLGEIRPDQLRSVRIQALADSGAMMLVLPQDLVEALGLLEVGKAIVTYADERKEERPLAGIVTVRAGNRTTSLNCVVGPPNSEPLLGQVVLETMDLLVDCTQGQLVPRPESPFLPLLKLK